MSIQIQKGRQQEESGCTKERGRPQIKSSFAKLRTPLKHNGQFYKVKFSSMLHVIGLKKFAQMLSNIFVFTI